MRVGDLVRYKISDLYPTEHWGIITKLPDVPNPISPQVHIVWYACDNEGWWNADQLEVLSEGR